MLQYRDSICILSMIDRNPPRMLGLVEPIEIGSLKSKLRMSGQKS